MIGERYDKKEKRNKSACFSSARGGCQLRFPTASAWCAHTSTHAEKRNKKVRVSVRVTLTLTPKLPPEKKTKEKQERVIFECAWRLPAPFSDRVGLVRAHKHLRRKGFCIANCMLWRFTKKRGTIRTPQAPRVNPRAVTETPAGISAAPLRHRHIPLLGAPVSAHGRDACLLHQRVCVCDPRDAAVTPVTWSLLRGRWRLTRR